jgi:endonuclease YncB( thermonuclease family)
LEGDCEDCRDASDDARRWAKNLLLFSPGCGYGAGVNSVCHRGWPLGRTLFSFCVSLLVGVVLRPAVAAETATVIQVLDGDTCRLHDNRDVRYLGIDAPEKGDPLAEEATQANNKLVANRTVRLELGRPAQDRNGRLLAYVFVGRTLVNEELVRGGWAHVRRPVTAKYRERLLKAQEAARAAGAGIWAGVSNISLAIVGVNAKAGVTGASALTNEFIVIQNQGSNAVNLTGWSVVDEGNMRYLFPNFSLAPGAKVTLRTGVGKNSAADLYWGNRRPVWNDEGDSIFIKDSDGRLVLSHVY